MSADAAGWTYRHSPYRGAAFAVHLAIADSANDQNGNLFWMRLDQLAKKARVGRDAAREAIRRMEEDGMLECVERSTGGRSRASVYRFLFADAEVVYETRARAAGKAQPKPAAQTDVPAAGPRVDPQKPAAEPRGIEPKEELTQEEPNHLAPLVASFDEAWDRYPPRKGGKQAAAKAWERTVKAGADPAVLLAAVENYATCRTAWGQAEARFTKHAATFFGPDRHWEDWVAGVPPGEMPVRKESRGERDLRFLNERRAARRAEPNLMMRELLP